MEPQWPKGHGGKDRPGNRTRIVCGPADNPTERNTKEKQQKRVAKNKYGRYLDRKWKGSGNFLEQMWEKVGTNPEKKNWKRRRKGSGKQTDLLRVFAGKIREPYP